MNRFLLKSVCLFALILPSASALAQFNGLKVNPRVFNDYPNSTLTIVTSNSVPGTGSIDDRNMVNATGNGANRHDILLSADNGATAYTFNPNQTWNVETTFTLTDGTNSPRKEAGLRINDPVTGDVLFIVNSDAGEIVTFGGGGAFHLFGNNGGGNGYTPGTAITMGMKYTPGVPNTTGGTPASIEYYVNYPALGGFVTTGPLAFSNLEGGPLAYSVGVYGQGGSGNNANDFLHVQFSNITGSIVPEPASLAVLSLGGLTLIRRRRCA
jgi:hypothetical protein